MTTETRTLEIPVFRCKDGLPTCVNCILKLSSKYVSFCGFDGEPLNFDRGDVLRPSPNCPLWKGEG